MVLTMAPARISASQLFRFHGVQVQDGQAMVNAMGGGNAVGSKRHARTLGPRIELPTLSASEIQ